MPKDELPELDSEQSHRIIEMAKSSKYIKDMMKKSPVDHALILADVGLDFGRTMNQIIMEKTMEKSADQLKDMIPANLTLPPKSLDKETPYFGMVPIPQHDFPEQFSNFCFNSLYIKEEVIRAMVDIRAECNDLLVSSRIFDTSINKTLRVEEFKQYQSTSISGIKYATRETGWVGKLEKITKASFTDVGKGWFNIQETSPETYEFGKLKKFLTLVNFMMQDTVLSMCKESVRNFVEFIHKFIPVSSEIHSTDKVINTFHKVLVEDEEMGLYDHIP
jgi:dynein heavy chain